MIQKRKRQKKWYSWQSLNAQKPCWTRWTKRLTSHLDLIIFENTSPPTVKLGSDALGLLSDLYDSLLLNTAFYQTMLTENVQLSVCDLKLKLHWVMQQEKQPNHTSKLTIKLLKIKDKIKVFEQSNQSLFCNLIEMLGHDPEQAIQAQKPSSVTYLKTILKRKIDQNSSPFLQHKVVKWTLCFYSVDPLYKFRIQNKMFKHVLETALQWCNKVPLSTLSGSEKPNCFGVFTNRRASDRLRRGHLWLSAVLDII